MKALMYHYIREGSEDLPYFRYLHIDDFTAQLEELAADHNFISQEEFLISLKTHRPIKDGVILTFDDAFSDHYRAAKELASRGLWGIFYIPTGPYQRKRLLDVHRVHMLIGKYGGQVILKALGEILTEDMISYQDQETFHHVVYSLQENEAATAEVKKRLNYSVKTSVKEQVLKQLMDHFYPDEAALMERFYLTPEQMKEMHDIGMIIGSHSVTHPVFSRLSVPKQRKEIVDSYAFLEDIIGEFTAKSLCFPYGGDHVFTQDTIDILQAEETIFSFNVEQKDIEAHDLKNRPMALPRYDCNQFIHGKASMGLSRA